MYISPAPDNINIPIVIESDHNSITITELIGEQEFSVALAAFNLGGEGPAVFDTITTLGSC